MITIKIIYRVLLIFSLFFLFNLNEIDSNSGKMVFYDKVNIHDENKFKIYFKKNVNSYDLNNIIKNYNLDIINYIIDNQEYYAKDVYDLISKYTIDKYHEEKIYYEINGINIDGLTVICENDEIRRLSLVEKIY